MLSKEKATPSKSDRADDSVLFSLRELRRVEDERVKAEADARRAQAERRTASGIQVVEAGEDDGI